MRKICDDTSDMNMTELIHNQVFVKNGEAWYRDFKREISARDLVREIIEKHIGADDAEAVADDENFDQEMVEAGFCGTDDMYGVCSILYTLLFGMADVREWLKIYETYGLPTTPRPEVLQQAVDTWEKNSQVDVAVEEMSELTKALIKERRGAPGARQDILEEMADVIIMLMQLLMIFGGREEVQIIIDEKVKRLMGRLYEDRKNHEYQ